MNKPNVAKFINNIQSSVTKHSPEILTGIGIAGMITTTVLAVKATPKALQLIEEAKKEQQVDTLTPVDTIKTCWKCYIPAAVTGVASVACMIGASSVHVKRNAALATAYKLSETALSEYKEKVVETIGEKKEQVIREAIDKDHVEKNPISQNEVIITKKGETLCFDYYSSRYFESDIEQIKKAINQLNGAMLREDYVSLNDLYDELGLSHTGVGDCMGWNAGRVGRDLIQPRISSQIAEDGRPCIVVSCDPSPWHDYDKYS
jgi:hypothetical protein